MLIQTSKEIRSGKIRGSKIKKWLMANTLQELSMNYKEVKHDSWNKTPEFILHNSNPTEYI